MRVKILEDKISDLDEATGQHYNLSKDDTITVPDALGKYWLSLGWAEDTEGKVKTGERKAGVQELAAIDKGAHMSKTTTKATAKKKARS